MSDVTLSEVKQLLESQAARDDRRREADVERFARFEGIVQTLTNEVAFVRKRQDQFEERLLQTEDRTRAAVAGAAELEGRLIGAVGSFADRVNGRLNAQDGEMRHIKDATDAQTAILATLTKYMNGAEANTRMLKWLVPLIGGAVVAVIPAMWYVLNLLAVHH